MMRSWALVGAAMFMFLSGCATDDRRTQVNLDLSLLDETTTKVKRLKEEIISATDRLGADKKLNLSKALADCDDLKEFCSKQVQKQALVMQSLRTPVSEADKEKYKADFQASINEKINALDKATSELNVAIKNLEKAVDDAVQSRTFATETDQNDAKKAVDDLKKKLTEAEGEFQSISRKA